MDAYLAPLYADWGLAAGACLVIAGLAFLVDFQGKKLLLKVRRDRQPIRIILWARGTRGRARTRPRGSGGRHPSLQNSVGKVVYIVRVAAGCKPRAAAPLQGVTSKDFRKVCELRERERMGFLLTRLVPSQLKCQHIPGPPGQVPFREYALSLRLHAPHVHHSE